MLNKETKVYAIVPAGGIGKRMNSRQPKQFLSLNSEPILSITLRALAKSRYISKFIIPTIDIVYTRKIIASYCPDIDVEIIKGGKTRQDSIHEGIKLLETDKPDLILIHDAVRALILPETIDAVIEAAAKHGAATAASPISDTLKLASEINGESYIRKNISRENMWAMQTPQVFKTELLIAAYAKAFAEDFIATDTTALLERSQTPVALVRSPNSNIKITTPEDLKIAESYLSSNINAQADLNAPKNAKEISV